MAQLDGSAPPAPPADPEAIKAVPVRHPGRWVAAVVVLLGAVVLAHSMATNPRYQWGVVGHYLFDSRIVGGVRVTLELTLCAQLLGVALGVI
ncbi:MAG TPA: amino acid ABC transporter permease, partial [Solirubrobacteraceae bacterium]|nr:amino acid ABC transporter permease [Solirubrobacteraceae bacterium]